MASDSDFFHLQVQLEAMHRQIEAAMLYGSAYNIGLYPGLTGLGTEQSSPKEPAMPDPPADLPKQDFLLKLLNMTTSSADAEALLAIRKVNKFLQANGWTWDMLLASKIKIIADPFSGLGTPSTLTKNKPPPPPQPRLPVFSTTLNRYDGFCYCCGWPIGAKAGFLFTPADYNTAAPLSAEPICVPCNTDAGLYVPHVAASRRPPPAPKKQPRAQKYDVGKL